MSKTLVLFYSYEGNTKKIAELIANNIGADIEEIKPVNEMRAKGFGKYMWGGAQVVMKKRPALKSLQVNLKEYDTIFLGSPVWASTFSPPVYSLLENGYLTGKKIAFFHCHEGGPGKAEEHARTAIEKENTFLSTYGCLNVATDFESLQEPVIAWAKETISQA